MTDTATSTELTIGPVRFSFMHVFEPKRDNGKYQVSLIIPKSDTSTIQRLKAALKAAYKAKYPNEDWANLPPGKKGLRDGDVERAGDEAYADSVFINVSSSNPPGIREKGTQGLQEVTDPTKWVSGDYGYANINCFGYGGKSQSGETVPKGASAGLNNILFTAKGEPLTSRRSADDAFADLELDMETPAATSDDDLLG